MTAKILVVDDDQNICDILRLYLEKEKYEVLISNEGLDALCKWKSFSPDLVLLDIMLPGMDGWQVCRKIREKSACPIIIISAKEEIIDKVLGLELGADDYITKPFDLKEVIARIKAVLRRRYSNVEEKSNHRIVYDKLIVDMDRYEIIIDGEKTSIPAKEMDLLYYLASNPNKAITREDILNKVWGYSFAGDSRTLDVHIKRLRSKLEGVSDMWKFTTIWKIGYKFEVKS